MKLSNLQKQLNKDMENIRKIDSYGYLPCYLESIKTPELRELCDLYIKSLDENKKLETEVVELESSQGNKNDELEEENGKLRNDLEESDKKNDKLTEDLKWHKDRVKQLEEAYGQCAEVNNA
jgi:predicted nuclease with TOPRIM domain